MGNRTYLIVKTVLGPVGVGFRGDKIARLWLPGLKMSELTAKILSWGPDVKKRSNAELAGRIERYFKGDTVEFPDRVYLYESGVFAKQVYGKLRKVKRGETISYKQLARRLGRPNAARAVGSILGKNPAPLIIPCHRVIKSDGSLGEFTSPKGALLKEHMLKLET